MKRRTFGAKRRALMATCYAALALTPACESTRSGANPEVPIWKHRPAWAMHLIFDKEVVAKSRQVGEPYERGRPEIDPTHGRVFVPSSDRGLYALSAVDGSHLWRFETLGFVQCHPLYDGEEDVVYFGSNDGALYKVRADTGALLWRFRTNAEVARQPVLRDGVVYATNANDTVIALDRRSGELIWTQHRTPAAGMEVAGYSGPTLFRGRIYVGFSDGTVTAFDARSGDERWQPVDLSAEAEQLLGEVPQYLDVDTTPVATNIDAGAVVIVGSYQGGVYALDADTGTQIWSNPDVLGVSDIHLWVEPAHEPAAGGPRIPERRYLLVSTGTTGLWALDPENGTEEWHRPLPLGGVSQPVPIAGALMVNTTQLGVFLVSPLDGSLIDGIHLADGSSSTPAIYGTRAYVVSDYGRLLGLHVTPPLARPSPSTLPPI